MASGTLVGLYISLYLALLSLLILGKCNCCGVVEGVGGGYLSGCQCKGSNSVSSASGALSRCQDERSQLGIESLVAGRCRCYEMNAQDIRYQSAKQLLT